jgi:hypothetical protein
MNPTIKNILNQNITKEKKIQLLEAIKKDIDFAEKVTSGEFEYCDLCDDYYLAESFIYRNETKPGKICIYKDPINSGGNEYAPGYIDTVYKICPKGHQKIYAQDEREERSK